LLLEKEAAGKKTRLIAFFKGWEALLLKEASLLKKALLLK
jgi:hypothetical protein